MYSVDYILDLPIGYIKSRFGTSSDVTTNSRYEYLKLLSAANMLDRRSARIISSHSFKHYSMLSDSELIREFRRTFPDKSVDKRSEAILLLMELDDKNNKKEIENILSCINLDEWDGIDGVIFALEMYEETKKVINCIEYSSWSSLSEVVDALNSYADEKAGF